MSLAYIEDYEITKGRCRSDGAEEEISWDVHLICREIGRITIPDLVRDRDAAAGFGERWKHEWLDPEDLPEHVHDYLGEIFGLPLHKFEVAIEKQHVI